MLRVLRIRNLAVIEAAEVEFGPGFNVLTGETGAGKSILVDAVGLLLGARASADLVRTGEDQATLEAVFEVAGEGSITMRREITSQGRSRSLIDGSPATAASLRAMASRLVEVHGQHEHQALLDPTTHLLLLDGSAHLSALSERVAAEWTAMRALRDELDRVRMGEREKQARLELIAVQLEDIEKTAPRPGEDDELATTRHVLANAERVQRLCEEAYMALHDHEQAVLPGLGLVWKRVGELATLEPRFAAYLEARDGIKAQLEDLAFFLRRYADTIDSSPSQLQQVEDRLALLDRLKRRYGPTLDEVVARRDSLRRERDLLTRADEVAGTLEAALADARRQYLATAEELSVKRRKEARRFASALEAELDELAMARTRFEVRFGDDAREDTWSARGIDEAEFFVSPNPGEALRPLARIVSGGELSRVMLAVRAMTAAVGEGRTLIFDEVDAGIGGRVAEAVAAKLQQLGRRFQVICITHLPQIASRAATHFRIDKSLDGARTVTTVQRLDDAGRVEEIGRMISGRDVSEPVRASAQEMLGLGAKGKQKAKGESKGAQRRWPRST